MTHGLRVRPFSTAFFATRPAPIITLGFDVFVQLVIAAITTEPCSSWVAVATAAPPPLGLHLHALLQFVERAGERRLGLRKRHAILRAARAREARLDRAEIELHRLAVGRIRRVGGPEQALRFRVGLDQRDLLRVAAGEAQVIERHVVDREDRDRGAIFRAHVAERHAIGDRQVRQAGPKNSTNLPTTPFLRMASVIVSTRSVAVAPSGSLPVSR